MTYKTFRRICTAILISLALMLEVKAQNIPIYGNLVPSDSGALDLGSPSLHWDTIFVNNIYPPVSGSGIWFEINDSTAGYAYGGDTFIVSISAGSFFIGNYTGSTIDFNATDDITLSAAAGEYNLGATAAQQSQLAFFEDTDNGSNNITLQSPASLAANYTLTLPADDGNNNELLKTNGSGVLSWQNPNHVSPWQISDTNNIFWQSSQNELIIISLTPTSYAFFNSNSGFSMFSDSIGFNFNAPVEPTDSAIQTIGTGAKRWSDGYINSVSTYSIIDEGSRIDTTASDTVTINAISGRFRKDTSGSTFTVTNSYITTASIVIVTPANLAIDATATTWTVDVSGGNILVTFNAAPTANFDMNFIVIN